MPAVPPPVAPAPVDLRDASDPQAVALAGMLAVPPVADELGALFARAGHRLHLVGGSVRDLLRGVTDPPDLDFTTDATPEQVEALTRGWHEGTWDLGRAFGTVGLVKGGQRLEVTTYRTEQYDGESRNPVVRFGTTLEEDLARRDFTVNAMAVSVPDHVFVDPHGGLRDLAAGVLRTPGPAHDSFTDDPLRMLRALRFAATLPARIDDDVLAAMRDLAPALARITAERVQVELTKTLLAPDPVPSLEALVDTGLADVVLPELPALRLEHDPLHRHKDVYAHSLQVLRNAVAREDRLPEAPDLVLRLAALLHDVGKPATRAFGPGGTVTFHKHDTVGAKLVRARLRALKYPRQVVDDVTELVRLHLRFHGYKPEEGTGSGAREGDPGPDAPWTDSAVRRYVTDAGRLLERLHVLVRSDCTTRNPRRARALDAAYQSLEDRIAELRRREDVARAKKPELTGEQVMALLHLAPGPAVGRALAHLSALKLERGPLGEEAATAELLAWARETGTGTPDPPA